MNAYYHKIQIERTKSFNVRNERIADFGDLYHFHPEVELRYIEEGQGIQYIGNEVSSFSAGSLFLVGENLPHAWRFNKKKPQNNASNVIESRLIEFSTQFSLHISNIPEAQAVRTLFEMAKQGLKIEGESKVRLVELLKKISGSDSQNRIFQLMQIIEALSMTTEYSIISPGYSHNELGYDPKQHRLGKVFSFVTGNYFKEIKLEQVAALANFSIGAFCRYFKSITGQTFFEYVNQIRISMACKKLIGRDASIEMVCYECGFNTLSNFNRIFRRITGKTPSDFKKMHLAHSSNLAMM